MYLITKVSILITLVLTMNLVAESLGFVEKKYSNYILIIGLAIQTILLAIFSIIIASRKRQLKRTVKIPRYRFEDRYIKGDTNILPKNISTTNPGKSSIFKIYFEIKDFKKDEPPDFCIFSMGKEPMEITDMKKHLADINIGIEDNLFIFNADIIVRPNQEINFAFKKDTNIKTFFVGEVYIP